MPAFDVTASPPQLTLEPGKSGTVVVTVTNRLGRAVTARADKVVEPATAAAWFKSPPDVQRTFTGSQATEKFTFEVAVPPDAPASSVKFRVDVVEVGAPDDNFGQSNTVAVTVPAAEIKPPPPPPPAIPVWVWPLVALVVIGAGIGIWMMLREGGGGDMPDVVGRQFDAAESTLKDQWMVVLRVDSLSSGADTVRFPFGAVLAQSPAPGTRLGAAKDVPDTARLVVQRDFTVVPGDILSVTPVEAASRLGLAGLPAKPGTAIVRDRAAVGKVVSTVPAPGTLVARGDSVAIRVGFFCAARCVFKAQIPADVRDAMLRANAEKLGAARRPPGNG